MLMTSIASRHWQDAASSRPVLERFQDIALIKLMADIYTARPAAKAASASDPRARTMIEQMAGYQAQMKTFCRQGRISAEDLSDYTAARFSALASPLDQKAAQDLAKIEIRVLRGTAGGAVLAAFDNMIHAGCAFLDKQAASRSMVRTSSLSR